jgi:DNA primase
MEVRSIVPSKKQRLLLGEEVRRNHEFLVNGKEHSQSGRNYLEARGITPDIVNRWKLGYVESGTYRGRISIPYWTPAGYSAAVYRCVHLPGAACQELEHHSKYLATSGYRPMFNVRALSVGADRVFVAEGELNAIMSSYDGFPCVATGGKENWKEWWSYCFDGPREIVVLRDGDEAGKEFADHIKHQLRNVVVIDFPDGQDVSSYRLEHGPEGLRSLIHGVLDSA